MDKRRFISFFLYIILSRSICSSTSTSTSSCLADLDFTKSDECRLRDHISSLKTIRSSIQSSIVELEPLHADPDVRSCSEGSRSLPRNEVSKQLDLEAAVLQQELMANSEEMTDLRAKVYLLDKEKAAQELLLSDRISMEQINHVSLNKAQNTPVLRRLTTGARLLRVNGFQQTALLPYIRH